MRKMSGAFLSLLMLSAPAMAYDCQFLNNDNVVHKCKIDSTGKPCSYKFGELTGQCAAQKSDQTKTDILYCFLLKPASASDPANASAPSNLDASRPSEVAKALVQLPGFVAGGMTIADSEKGMVAGAYVEKTGAPTLSAICTP